MPKLIQDLDEPILSDEDYNDQSDIPSDADDLLVESSDSRSDSDEDETSDEDEDQHIRLPHRKPPRASQADLIIDSELSGDESDVSTTLDASFSASERRRFTKHIACSESEQDLKLLYPTSLQPGQDTYVGLDHERQVLEDFATFGVLVDETSDEDSFNSEELYNVSVYRSIDHPNGLHGQLEALHTVASEPRSGLYYLDGDLRRGEDSRRLVGVLIRPFGVNIGALEYIEKHTAREDIWVQTVTGRTADDTWYKLKGPSAEYAKLYEQSLWLADLIKHVADYCNIRVVNGHFTSLNDFAEAFSKQLRDWHGQDEDFQRWFTACGKPTDFRKHVLRNAQSLWDHLYNLDDDSVEQPLWREIGAISDAHQDQGIDPSDEKTVVTDSVQEAFLECCPHWGCHELDLLEAVPYSQNVAAVREERLETLGFPDSLGPGRSQTFCQTTEDGRIPKASLFMEQAASTSCHTILTVDEIVGKIIVVKHTFKKGHDAGYYYAWALSSHRGRIKVMWLLQPSMTMCGSEYDGTFYPVGNELFFDQDRCSCSDVILTNNIFGVFDAIVLGVVYGTYPELFVRQTYSQKDQTMVLATEDSIRCKNHQRLENIQTNFHDPCSEEREPKKLRTLSLFAGCGLLDYSLVDSGFFEIVQAIDLDSMAIKSHKLNAKSTGCEHRVESVNRHLKQILLGQDPINNIQCLVAGCPCQGFSSLNKFKHNLRGQKNCSMLAGTVASIEVHLPLFAIIENVPGMDSANPKKGRGNACAQAICHLVALGYQVRKMVVPAQAYGASTRRKRLFLIAAAPQMTLPDMPPITHGDSLDLEEEVRVCDALKDLEPIDEHIAVNPRQPDHVPILRLKSRRQDTVSLRNIVQRIPTSPPGQGLALSYRYLTREQKSFFKTLSEFQRRKGSTSLQRIDLQRPFQTIVTIASPLDGCGGGHIVHPKEHRILSLEEFRRAQGTPDSFLLVGSISSQLQQQGNGVPWQLGLAIGTTFGEAWKRSYQNAAGSGPSAGEGTAQQAIFNNAATSERPHRGGQQTQRELRDALEIGSHSSSESHMGDTIVFRPLSPSSSEADGTTTDVDHTIERLDAKFAHPSRSDLIEACIPGLSKPEDQDKLFERSESGSSVPASHQQASTLSTATPDGTSESSYPVTEEDIAEISEHEFFDINLKHRHRKTFARKYTNIHRQPNIVVEIPIGRKRSTPAKEEEVYDDDEVIYVKTQPVDNVLGRADTMPAAKRPRLRISRSAESHGFS